MSSLLGKLQLMCVRSSQWKGQCCNRIMSQDHVTQPCTWRDVKWWRLFVSIMNGLLIHFNPNLFKRRKKTLACQQLNNIKCNIILCYRWKEEKQRTLNSESCESWYAYIKIWNILDVHNQLIDSTIVYIFCLEKMCQCSGGVLCS